MRTTEFRSPLCTPTRISSFAQKPREGDQAGHRQGADDERRRRDRELRPQAAELVDLLLLSRVDHGAAARNSSALKNACANRYSIAAPTAPEPSATNISPRLFSVE